ncbi:MAG: HD domain-containing protein [Candidatus Dormibacteraeota bacterium]|nr:HD domain-containing protein [Candidatus Dormibacteraeota bacterium]
MALTIPDICALYELHGSRMYSGEPVTQLEHALQSAALAEATGADAELITAALLHDLGHLLNDQGDTPTARGIDDAHQYFALPFLRGLFDDQVLEPIRLHVDAKRYLCATRPAYHDALSADSKRSLALQGGTFSAADAAVFIARPGAERAVELRLWDDAAKLAGQPTPPLTHFSAIMAAAARGSRD